MWELTGTGGQLLLVYIVHFIGFSNRNGYLWMKEIHTIRTMGIVVSAKRTISKSL
jgi:hypothetical protein